MCVLRETYLRTLQCLKRLEFSFRGETPSSYLGREVWSDLGCCCKKKYINWRKEQTFVGEFCIDGRKEDEEDCEKNCGRVGRGHVTDIVLFVKANEDEMRYGIACVS